LLSKPEKEDDFSTVSKKMSHRRDNNSKKKETSCCKVLCFISLGLFGLFILTATVTYVWAYRFVKHEVIRFTVPDPMELPNPIALPEAECEVIKDRAKLFYDTIVAGQEPGMDLSVSQGEVNGCFVAHSDYLRGKFFVSIANNNIEVKISLPTDFLPGGSHRYLVAHGNAQIKTNEDDGSSSMILIRLDTYKPIQDIDGPLLSGEFDIYEEDNSKKFVMNILGGNFLNWIVPQDYVDEKENLLEDMYDDSQMATLLMGIQGISSSDEFITILARRGGGEDKGDKVPMMPKDVQPKSNGSSRRILRKLLF